ncbi:hypothetical protein B0H14DRAFT_2595756 [Mycena olivaceomarginata]|nr:hypothetical protein B0H14DRAFT_2595756 [Mycena olivaceomarginata]
MYTLRSGRFRHRWRRRARILGVEAKLGQRKAREQAEASLGRILDTATAGDTHIGGWSAQTEEHGRTATTYQGTERQSRCPGPQEGMSELRGIGSTSASGTATAMYSGTENLNLDTGGKR